MSIIDGVIVTLTANPKEFSEGSVITFKCMIKNNNTESLPLVTLFERFSNKTIQFGNEVLKGKGETVEREWTYKTTRADCMAGSRNAIATITFQRASEIFTKSSSNISMISKCTYAAFGRILVPPLTDVYQVGETIAFEYTYSNAGTVAIKPRIISNKMTQSTTIILTKFGAATSTTLNTGVPSLLDPGDKFKSFFTYVGAITDTPTTDFAITFGCDLPPGSVTSTITTPDITDKKTMKLARFRYF